MTQFGSQPQLRIKSFIAIAILAIAFCSTSFAGKSLKVGEKAPNWILPNSANQQVSFYKDSADQAAVILFWATWCPYCAELMPELKTLQAELKQADVKFYALNVWEDDDADAYLKKHQYEFSLMLNADMVAKRYGVHGTPGLIVVDKDKVIRYIRAKNTSAEDAANQVKAALEFDQ